MFAPANSTSAPRSSAFICARNRSRRSMRNRSKSTRRCQSAPVWLYTRRGSHSCGRPMKLMSMPDALSTTLLMGDGPLQKPGELYTIRNLEFGIRNLECAMEMLEKFESWDLRNIRNRRNWKRRTKREEYLKRIPNSEFQIPN